MISKCVPNVRPVICMHTFGDVDPRIDHSTEMSRVYFLYSNGIYPNKVDNGRARVREVGADGSAGVLYVYHIRKGDHLYDRSSSTTSTWINEESLIRHLIKNRLTISL